MSMVKKNDWLISLVLSIYSCTLFAIFYVGLITNNIGFSLINDDLLDIVVGSVIILSLLGLISVCIVLWAIIIVVENLFSKWLLYAVLSSLLLVTIIIKIVFNLSVFEYLIFMQVLIPTIFFLPGIYLISRISINKRKKAIN